MEMIFVIASVLQSIGVSLGVGCSTISIINFFVALADGKIEESERKMMGVAYILLRVAMVIILLTTALLAYIALQKNAIELYSAFSVGVWTLVVVLYVNAVLMTKHIMPSTVGPALQAGTWYTLGVIMALVPLKLTNFTYFQFLFAYFAVIALSVTIVNAVMGHLKHNRLK